MDDDAASCRALLCAHTPKHQQTTTHKPTNTQIFMHVASTHRRLGTRMLATEMLGNKSVHMRHPGARLVCV